MDNVCVYFYLHGVSELKPHHCQCQGCPVALDQFVDTDDFPHTRTQSRHSNFGAFRSSKNVQRLLQEMFKI